MTQTTDQITLDDEKVRRMLRGVNIRAKDVRRGWRVFQQYMRARTNQTFERLRHGGTFRGVHWDYFKPQYRRRDGTLVPAWGGVRKVKGGGEVLGQKRPSGSRVRRGDSILQDTETLRGRAALVQRMTRNTLVLGPQGVRYAAPQHRRRPFLFFEVPRDLSRLTHIMVEEIRVSALKAG